ncbi:unnamed protein product [Lota lota]
MLCNIKAFVNHLDLFHRGSSKLTSVQVGQLKQTIKSMQSDVLRDVITHRQMIKRRKSRTLQKVATPSDLDMVYGYIAGYLAIVSGHWQVVFTSMKIKDGLDAEKKGDRFVLWAKKHPSAEDRTRVATSMCHDVATADKFYCPVPDLEDAFEVRQLRMRALVEGLENSDDDPTEDEELPGLRRLPGP